MNRLLRSLIPLLFSLFALIALTPPAAAGVGVWTQLGPDGGSVWALAVDPADPSVVYAGTRNGVFKSTDGGDTWTAASKGLGPRGVFVRAFVLSGNAVYAGTDDGVYKSVDGGGLWTKASAGIPPSAVSPHIRALAADPRSPNRIWASTNRGVFLTTNGGATWQGRQNGFPRAVDPRGIGVTPDGRTVYVATRTTVYKSTNQGQKWTRVDNGLDSGGFNDLFIDPANPSTVFVGGQGLWKTTNGGGKWTRVAPSVLTGGLPALAIQGQRMYVHMVLPARQEILFSEDRGATWKAATTDPSDHLILDLAAGPDAVYAGSSSDYDLAGVYRSLDHGRSWDLSIHGLISLGARGVAVDPENPDILYTGIESVGLFKSTDRGATWDQLPLDLPPFQPVRISATLVDPSDSSIVYAGTGFGPGGLFRSGDAGATWDRIEEVPLMVEALAADPRKPGAMWAAGSPGVYHSNDHGATWDRLPVPGGEDIWIRAFQVGPQNPNVVWAAGTLIEIRPGGIRVFLRLFRSANGGQTWERRDSGIAGDSVISLEVDPSNPDLLLAGTETGLYRSANAGVTWTKVPGFNAEVNELVAAPSTPTAFYANLEGFGVQRSVDGGITWTPARRGLAPVPVSTLAVDPSNPKQLYAGSETRGVFTYTEP